MKKIFRKLLKNCDLFKGKANGFTLAEVLITLGIIGIVAAVTIPTLVKKYQDKVFETKSKKTMATLSNGFKMLMANENVSDISKLSFATARDQAQKTNEYQNIQNSINEIVNKSMEERIACLSMSDSDSAMACISALNEERNKQTSGLTEKQDNIKWKISGFDKVFKIQKKNVYEISATNPNVEKYSKTPTQLRSMTSLSQFFKKGLSTINNSREFTFVTEDGTQIELPNGNSLALVDLNGQQKGPNILGKDVRIYRIAKTGLTTDITQSVSTPITYNDMADYFAGKGDYPPTEACPECPCYQSGGTYKLISGKKFRCTIDDACFESDNFTITGTNSAGQPIGRYEGHPCN